MGARLWGVMMSPLTNPCTGSTCRSWTTGQKKGVYSCDNPLPHKYVMVTLYHIQQCDGFCPDDPLPLQVYVASGFDSSQPLASSARGTQRAHIRPDLSHGVHRHQSRRQQLVSPVHRAGHVRAPRGLPHPRLGGGHAHVSWCVCFFFFTTLYRRIFSASSASATS